MIVTLNHTIHFYNQQSFRADEVMHVEMTTPWARDGRALAHSRIFDNEGELIATCVQEVRPL
jgi:acyl-CoA thioesterase II